MPSQLHRSHCFCPCVNKVSHLIPDTEQCLPYSFSKVGQFQFSWAEPSELKLIWRGRCLRILFRTEPTAVLPQRRVGCSCVLCRQAQERSASEESLGKALAVWGWVVRSFVSVPVPFCLMGYLLCKASLPGETSRLHYQMCLLGLMKIFIKFLYNYSYFNFTCFFTHFYSCECLSVCLWLLDPHTC